MCLVLIGYVYHIKMGFIECYITDVMRTLRGLYRNYILFWTRCILNIWSKNVKCFMVNSEAQFFKFQPSYTNNFWTRNTV